MKRFNTTFILFIGLIFNGMALADHKNHNYRNNYNHSSGHNHHSYNYDNRRYNKYGYRNKHSNRGKCGGNNHNYYQKKHYYNQYPRRYYNNNYNNTYGYNNDQNYYHPTRGLGYYFNRPGYGYGHWHDNHWCAINHSRDYYISYYSDYPYQNGWQYGDGTFGIWFDIR